MTAYHDGFLRMKSLALSSLYGEAEELPCRCWGSMEIEELAPGFKHLVNEGR